MRKEPFTHPVFGSLVHVAGDLWQGEVRLHLLGDEQRLPLYVDIHPEDGIEANQITAFEQFSASKDRVSRACDEAVRAEFHKATASSEAIEIRDALHPTGITFPYARGAPTFGILFDCAWEFEHGLAAKFEHGSLAEVGPQDIVL